MKRHHRLPPLLTTPRGGLLYASPARRLATHTFECIVLLYVVGGGNVGEEVVDVGGEKLRVESNDRHILPKYVFFH